MDLPIKTWLKKVWPAEEHLISKLPFITTKPGLVEYDNSSYIQIQVKVPMPANGPVCKIKNEESVTIALEANFPESQPIVLIRRDFPAVPHLSSRIEIYRRICLTRRDPRDWWVRKTLIDVVRDVYLWLCDAAAGTLIKNDDPFEPLIASGTTPVELAIERAKEECAKHEGSWTTTSQEIRVKNGESSRYIVGKGNVPTQVWYQQNERAELWIDPPMRKEDVLEMMSLVGFDRERVNYWIGRGKTHLLMVVGIRRKIDVLGKWGTDEWVAFELKRKEAKEMCKWDVRTHMVLESFSPSIARLTSGFQIKDKNVVVIGGGALGSEICESLARSGTSHLTLIDNDILQPHNLARHTLGPEDIGEYKADALAKKINSFYGVEICRGMHDDFLCISADERHKVLESADCLVDCSASVGVQARLGDLVPAKKPIISGFQIDGGRATILLYSPNVQCAEPAMLEAILITAMLDSSAIAQWLKEPATRVELGGGCSAISSIIPSSVIKLGAGWLADRVLRMVNSGVWLTNPFIEILQYDPLVGKVHTKKVDVDIPFLVMACGWRVFTTAYALAKVKEYAGSALPNETGGVMIGRLDRQRRVAYITEAWKAPKDSASTRTGFSRGLAGLKNRIAILEKDTNEYLSYVGEWHSHPPCSGSALSSVDSRTAKRMAAELANDRIPAVCLILDTQNWDTHVVENKIDAH